MCADRIDIQMQGYIAAREIAGAALIVRGERGVVYQNCWGYADIEAGRPVREDTIFRLASLTKPIIAAAVMILVEQGKLQLDDELGKYIPELAAPMVCKTQFNLESLDDLASLDLGSLEFEPARRPVTIRDLLSHSSGIGMGVAGMAAAMRLCDPSDTLESRFQKFRALPADFHPGEATGYSGLVGFDALGRVIEVISGMALDQFLDEHLFQLLGMTDTIFHLDDSRKERLAVLYKSENGELSIAPPQEDIQSMAMIGPQYHSGAGGLYSTLLDTDRFARMLLHEGESGGRRILQAETVRLMRRPGAYKHMEFAPGMVWGLGMIIRMDPKRAGSSLSKGSYGWSGAYGTHLFVDPVKKLSAVLMVNRSNIGGAASHVSKKVEDLIYQDNLGVKQR